MRFFCGNLGVSINTTLIKMEYYDMYGIGSTVFVDSFLKAYILDYRYNAKGITVYDVKYVIGDYVEKNVFYDRLSVCNINSNANNRSETYRTSVAKNTINSNKRQEKQRSGGDENVSCSSCFSQAATISSSPASSNQLQSNTTTSMSTTTTTASQEALYSDFKEAIHSSLHFHSSMYFISSHSSSSDQNRQPSNTKTTTTQQHPLVQFLCKHKGKSNGWLRKVIKAKLNIGDDIKCLSEKEKTIILTCSSTLSGLSSNNHSVASRWPKLLCEAFGVNKNSVSRLHNSFLDGDFSLARKKRSDTGSSIFNSSKKRKATFTPYMSFRKSEYKKFRPYKEKIPENEIKEKFNLMDSETKREFEDKAKLDYDRSITLWEELKDILLKTHGKLSYQDISQHLGGIVCHNTIRKYLMQQEGFKLKTDRVIPALDKSAKEKRVIWASTFWIFWKSCMAVPTSKVRFVMMHMDEKWFFAFKTRKHGKILTSIGLDKNHVYDRNKNKIYKEMYVVATAFIPHFNNDITKGGRAVPIACVRCGDLEMAEKDSFKRVTDDNGKITYPRIAENQLRYEGKKYFKPKELTGSSEGSLKDPKTSLLKIYKETIIPALENKIVPMLSNNGKTKVVIVKQEDNAGTHMDAEYLREMRIEFAKRDWLLLNQAPKSAEVNVHDSCVFPMMSKQVSSEQAFTFGHRVLRGEELYNTVMKVWKNDANLCAISRAFIHHTQVVNCILHYEGNNDYLYKDKGMHFGIRKSFINDEDGKGITIYNLAPENENETNLNAIMNHTTQRGLHFSVPDVRPLYNKAKITKEMLYVLQPYMEHSLMTDDLLEVWYRIEHSRT